MDDLAVNNNRLKVSQLVRKQFTILISATEVVNSLSNLIALKCIKYNGLTLRIRVPSGVDLVLLRTEQAALYTNDWTCSGFNAIRIHS